MSSLLAAWVCGIGRRLRRRRVLFVAAGLVLMGSGMSQRLAGGVGGEACWRWWVMARWFRVGGLVARRGEVGGSGNGAN